MYLLETVKASSPTLSGSVPLLPKEAICLEDSVKMVCVCVCVCWGEGNKGRT